MPSKGDNGMKQYTCECGWQGKKPDVMKVMSLKIKVCPSCVKKVKEAENLESNCNA